MVACDDGGPSPRPDSIKLSAFRKDTRAERRGLLGRPKI